MNREQFVQQFKVGDNICIPGYWRPDEYITITSIRQERFLANNLLSEEDVYPFNKKWELYEPPINKEELKMEKEKETEFVATFTTSQKITSCDWTPINPTMKVNRETTVGEIEDFYRHWNTSSRMEIKIIELEQVEQTKGN